MGEIVVGVEESEGAAQALRWAAREADLRGWGLTAVMAWGFLDQHHSIVGERFDPAYGEPDAAEAMLGIVSRALGPDGTRKVRRRAVCDLPAPALLEASADADLLVVGARGMGGFKGLMLGSISQQCLHHSTVPTAVVRSEPAARDQRSRIVVAVDGSEAAQRALVWAVDEAKARGAEITAVHAWHPPYVASEPYLEMAFDPGEFEKAACEVLAAAVARTDTEGVPGPVNQVVFNGSAARAVLETAEGADLIVMGSRGLGGFKGLLLGSVTTQVAHHAATTVVVIPAGQ